MLQEFYTFDDVLIVPQFSTVKSRGDVDLTSGGFKLPIMSANMDTVTGYKMAAAMAQASAGACLHRFGSIEANVNSYLMATALGGNPWVSIGLGEKELDRAEALFHVGARQYVIDVAHGAQQQVVEACQRLVERLPSAVRICVGNFSTGPSVKEFINQFKPTAIKVGIGPGSACTTRIKTGCGVPQLSAIEGVRRVYDGIIIADGGCRNPGDIAKALAAGADIVMIGGMLAGTEETPGEILPVYFGSNKSHVLSEKVYRGSASQSSYLDQGKTQEYMTAEGEEYRVPYTGPVGKILKDIEGGLRSAFAYVGARNIKEFHERAKFIRVTGNTVIENSAHGANK